MILMMMAMMVATTATLVMIMVTTKAHQVPRITGAALSQCFTLTLYDAIVQFLRLSCCSLTSIGHVYQMQQSTCTSALQQCLALCATHHSVMTAADQGIC